MNIDVIHRFNQVVMTHLFNSNITIDNVYYGKRLKRKILAVVPRGKQRRAAAKLLNSRNKETIYKYLVGVNPNLIIKVVNKK